MSRIFYPAVFHLEGDGGYSVSVPDLDGCFTEGDTLERAYEMTFDAVGLCLVDLFEQGKDFPVPSQPSTFQQESGDFIVLIEFDMLAYQKKHDTKAVKKTLTIPSWLNAMAESQHINFSSVLQAALKEKLDIPNR